MTQVRPVVEREVINGRLAYYRQQATPGFWDEHWQHSLSVEYYAAAERGELGTFTDIFTRRLPHDGPILEGGCGLAQHVVALRARGYDAEGVEWAPATVETVRARYPDLPVRAGDVTALDVPDHYYAAYLSLGVIEHREEGPAPFLREAFRILRPGGVLLVSVPYFHALRRLKARLGMYRRRLTGYEFYQYAFTQTELAEMLQQAGFRVQEYLPYDGYKGIKDEIPLAKYLIPRLQRVPRLGWRFARWLAHAPLGHMLMIAAVKPEDEHGDHNL